MIYLDCVGCEQRQMDAQRIKDYLVANNIPLATNIQDATYAIIVTCAVDSAMLAKTTKCLDNLRKCSPNLQLIIAGCLPAIDPVQAEKYAAIGYVLPKELSKLDEILCTHISKPIAEISWPNKTIFDSPDIIKPKNVFEEYRRAKKGFKIKINEGCKGVCTYCAIHNATGTLRSEAQNNILSQVQNAISTGEKTILLCGGDTGAYGQDTGYSFDKLLGKIIEQEGDFQIYIHDFNINWIIKDPKNYMALFKKDDKKRKIRFLNLPIQSGSNRILQLMQRPYSIQNVYKTLKEITNNAPHIALGTHMIIGFPTETEKDFVQTRNLIANSQFAFSSCFGYAEHATTLSAKLDQKIPAITIQNRLRRLKNEFPEKVIIYPVIECQN